MNISLRAFLTLSSLQVSCGEIFPSLPFTTIEKAYYSGIEDEYQDIFRTKMELESFWSKHKSKIFPIPPIPDVDFEGDHAVVAAVFSGLKSSGGYGIEIISVSANDNDVVIHYETNKPSPDSMVTMALTQPFHIVEIMLPLKLNQKNVDVQFQKQETNDRGAVSAETVTFMLVLSEGSDIDLTTQRIKDSFQDDVLISIDPLRAIQIIVVDFDLEKIEKAEAHATLKKINGVETVEEDREDQLVLPDGGETVPGTVTTFDFDASAGEKRAGWMSLTVPTFLFVGYYVVW
mmetsp:Transcript_43857/g.52597  ORF Transcript_43857/g.52597 Transcript_43857/m.52597 type:complete len:289 (-) Transcript_43857:171-1037(-)